MALTGEIPHQTETGKRLGELLAFRECLVDVLKDPECVRYIAANLPDQTLVELGRILEAVKRSKVNIDDTETTATPKINF